MVKKLIFKQKGIVLIISYLVISVLLIFSSAFVFTSINEKSMVERKKEISQAFYLAEAGIDRALRELRRDYNWLLNETERCWDLDEGTYGEYCVSVEPRDDGRRRVLASGFIPNKADFRVRYRIEAVIGIDTPSSNIQIISWREL